MTEKRVQSNIGKLGGAKRGFTKELKSRQKKENILNPLLEWLGLPKSGFTDEELNTAVDIFEKMHRNWDFEETDPEKKEVMRKKAQTILNEIKEDKKSGGKVYGTPTRKSQYKAG
tara:strand:+ start:2882 stop:3226 length:345 start_codon:yes stop_codon:yes gene_type:complete